MVALVSGVLSKQGTDLTPIILEAAQHHGLPPRLLVAQAIAESNLDERAARLGDWPDVSFGLWQQTVAYAPIGDQSNTATNIAAVRKTLTTDLALAADIAAAQLGNYWARYAEPLETMGRYNWPARGYVGNPNAANIRRGWETSARYLQDVKSATGASTALREAFLAKLRSQFGTPYVFGGKAPGGFDCSGYLTWCAREAGVDLGDPLMTNAEGLKRYCVELDVAQAAPGDVILFHSTYGEFGPNYATHCGVSLGVGSGRMYDTHVRAGDPEGAKETDIRQAYWQNHWLGGIWRPRSFLIVEESAPGTDATNADLINLLGYLQGDVARALQDALDDAAATTDEAHRRAVLQALQAAINTLRLSGISRPRTAIAADTSPTTGPGRADLINLLGYLQGDVATALQDALDGATAATTDAKRRDAFQALQSAINTLRTAGQP